MRADFCYWCSVHRQCFFVSSFKTSFGFPNLTFMTAVTRNRMNCSLSYSRFVLIESVVEPKTSPVFRIGFETILIFCDLRQRFNFSVIILVLITLASLCDSFQRLFSIAASRCGVCVFRGGTAKFGPGFRTDS